MVVNEVEVGESVGGVGGLGPREASGEGEDDRGGGRDEARGRGVRGLRGRGGADGVTCTTALGQGGGGTRPQGR